jgi:hypothetical protein
MLGRAPRGNTPKHTPTTPPTPLFRCPQQTFHPIHILLEAPKGTSPGTTTSLPVTVHCQTNGRATLPSSWLVMDCFGHPPLVQVPGHVCKGVRGGGVYAMLVIVRADRRAAPPLLHVAHIALVEGGGLAAPAHPKGDGRACRPSSP